MENPVVDRSADANAAVVFVHGFTGDGVGTWGTFPTELRKRADLNRFDLYFWEYPSKLSLAYAVTKWFWENDPGIETIGQGLRTLLHTTLGDGYEELVLVAHSMGGLVVQSYVLEELRRIREGTITEADSLVDRITEILLYATPSGGLGKARLGSFLKNQIGDMSDVGPFVTNLRSEWTDLVEGHRHEKNFPSSFRLTLVAGAKDRFVPPESALDPFPLDEHEIVGGNHASLVKPEKVGGQPVDILFSRLTRGTPTAEALRVVYGRDPNATARAQVALAAAEVGDVLRLEQEAAALLAEPARFPTVERALGLALSRQAKHDIAVQLFQRFLGFELSDGTKPFASDVQVIQQLAISESGRGDNVSAIARLRSLPEEFQTSETLGITAGRIKRQWLASGPPRVPALARQALDVYRAAYDLAKNAGEADQIAYAGINLAFMALACGETAPEVIQRVLEVTEDSSDYWMIASRAEAQLLLGHYDEAANTYESAFERTVNSRYLASTGLQAITAIDLRGSPGDASVVVELFEQRIGDHDTLAAVTSSQEEEKDTAEVE